MKSHLPKATFVFLTLFCFLLTSRPARADHIYGGHLTLRYTGTPGQYELSMFMVFNRNQTQGTPASYENPVVYIFRKRDNALMPQGFPQLILTNTTDLTPNNSACDRQRPLALTYLKYSRIITLAANQYNDPQGYYMIWERCCRSSGITNVVNSGTTGLVFRLDFPAVTSVNSSPDFVPPPAEYICINKPYTADFKATDADGDELRYELVNPLAGYTTPTPIPTGSGLSRASYPAINWAGGYSAGNAITGNPALSINPTTGLLTVRPNRLGIFAFTVLVREFRNGVEIGQVRRDYQFPVVDCAAYQNPPPLITYTGRDSTQIVRCDNSPITLTIARDTTFRYQWQRNGANITGQTGFSLTVSDTGRYTVTKKFIIPCGNDTISKAVQVLPVSPPIAKIFANRTELVFSSDTLWLRALPQPPYLQYVWTGSGAALPGERNRVWIANDVGLYRLRVSTFNNKCPAEDTIRITRFTRLYAPTAFTPNGDGQNDTWKIENIGDLTDTEVAVFDRWGNPVFYSQGYAQPWDGQSGKSGKVPAGVYAYIIRVPNRDPQRGSVQVIY
jgi:gliding motility-associated-like protein